MKFRADIQALRALAVSLVLLFHVWPTAVPGGYIGVDVFFVISGFLITGLLMREVETDGGIAFGRFYLRRAARLLPAALLVLGFVVLGAAIPEAPLFWTDIAAEVAASALYVENWYLHVQGLDYLAAGTAPSPVQHYWSLGVEEQFYLVWPLAVMYGTWLAARFRWPMRARGIGLVLGMLVVLSLAYAIWTAILGSAGPQYFSTYVRIWQLGVGGLLAAWRIRMPGWWPLPMGMLGIVASALLLNADSPYPGWLALLPTLSAAMMVAGGEYHNHRGLHQWLGCRTVQFLGNISYSLYLWHWPLVAFAALLWPGKRGWLEGCLLLVMAVLVSAASKRWVEDRFRLGHGRIVRKRRVLAGMAAGSVAVLAAAAGLSLASSRGQHSAMAVGAMFPGAAVVDGAPWSASDTRFIPPLAEVRDDLPDAYRSKCLQDAREAEVKACVYGADDAAVRIGLVGDSQAIGWFPAFRRLTEKYNLQFVGISKNACAFSFVMTWAKLRKQNNRSCLEWSHRVIDKAKGMDLDVVIVTQYTGYTAGRGVDLTEGSSQAQVAMGMVEAWRALEKATGKQVLLLHPTPYQPTNVPECAAKHAWPFAECTRASHGAFANVPFLLAARQMPRPMLDFTPYFCMHDECPAVIGGVFAYRDDHHVTATYIRSLAPMLARQLRRHGVALNPRRRDASAPEP